jgi:digalactosyldiacylglycerol synthase
MNAISHTKVFISGEELEKKTMTLSSTTPDLGSVLDNGLAFAHYFLSGLEPFRRMNGSLPDTIHIDAQSCKDLGLPPPHVQRPVYGW